MKNRIWAKALKDCADPPRARHFLELLSASTADSALAAASDVRAKLLATLFSGSRALSELLVTHPDWVALLEPDALKFPRRKQGLWQEVNRWLEPLLEASDYTAALARVREFKQRELLRIGARDLARLGQAPEITLELSSVADVCLEAVWRVCQRQMVQRYGQPWHKDADGHWQPTAGTVVGLGKLGGQELNYSSDVDVVFVYSEEGEVFKAPPGVSAARKPAGAAAEDSGRATLANHQFFNRLAEAFITEVTRLAPEGALYRIDLRLRPEGDMGPLSRSLAGFENYYAQWGQTWERMMLIKARGVAGDETLAAEFLEMIQPFRYPRSINESALREVGQMKDRIEQEVVKAGELERNVKLGRGGIREIEFIAQSLQLLHAGRQPFLQSPQTLPCLEKLVQYELLSAPDSAALRGAYCFLRDVEHRLQMEGNRQTHTIPSERVAGERLARVMGFATLKEFDAARRTHTSDVRRIFDRVLKGEVPKTQPTTPFPREFDGAEREWKAILAEHSFQDVPKAFRVLREFVEGPGYGHVSPRTRELALQLLPRLFARCPRAQSKVQSPKSKVENPRPSSEAAGTNGLQRSANAPLSDPDRVITRLDSFIAAYGARATLFELWHSNPTIFDLLVLLFDRSEFLAELAIRTPDLVDELVTSGRLRQRKTTEETLRDLRHGLADADQHLWLRRYHQAELMRIGLRDILGLADFEQYLTELSALADACLQYALEAVLRRHRLKSPPFAIIGLGKLGGAEIDYGSDLDLLFVAGPNAKNLPKLSRLAVEVMDLVSRRTEQGLVFHTDARLRPDGEKGLLVNTLTAYEEYYRRRAQLWEIQTLTRTRPIAGDARVGARFQNLAAKLTNFRQFGQEEHPARGTPVREKSLRHAHSAAAPVAYTPVWKQTIHQMRLRIQNERTPSGQDELAIKTGIGGLMDAEFIAQALCLEHGWQEANTLRALERGRAAGVLPDSDALIENYRRLRRLEGILRRWSYEGETVLPTDPAPYYRVSVRCGFSSPEAFRAALASWRRAVRSAYERFFNRS
jgi:glutamate-ammonia-ligase adenylyltransferase